MRRLLSLLPVLSLLIVMALPAAADEFEDLEACPLAQEMAVKGIDLFDIKPAEGINALERAYKKCSKDLGIGYNLGLANYMANNKTRAREVWAETLERFPDHLKTHANLAWVSFELGDDESAHILAFKGLNNHPGDLSLAHTKLFSLFRLGRYLEAYDWLTRSNIKGVQVAKWREQAVSYVVETLWQQFRAGERDAAVARAVILLRDYQDEELVTAKDKLVQALVDKEAEIPYPNPLPHETWAKKGDIGEGREMLDDFLATLPPLNVWQKRTDSYALFIGVYRYRKTNAHFFADRDARNLHSLLVSRGLFPNDLDHVRVRLSEEATYSVIQRDLEWLLQQARLNPNAMILFYYSGHGAVYKAPNNSQHALLVPVESVPSQISLENAISLNWYKSEIEKLPNKEVITLLDTCFTAEAECIPEGYDAKGGVMPESFFNWKKPTLLAAFRKGLKPYTQGRQNALTYFFIKGLIGGADGITPNHPVDGWVDLEEAVAYTKKSIAEHELAQDLLTSAIAPLRLSRTGGEQ